MKRIIAISCIVITGLAFITAFSGCETESASEEPWAANSGGGGALNISPGNATLSGGQTAEFTASGGYNYAWSLSDTSSGSLSSATGSKTTFTCTATNTSAPKTITLTLKSTIQDTAYSQTALAYITVL